MSGSVYDSCWELGFYDGQTCEFCPHKYECSGSEIEDEENVEDEE